MGHLLWVNMALSDSHLSHPADHWRVMSWTDASINALNKPWCFLGAGCCSSVVFDSGTEAMRQALVIMPVFRIRLSDSVHWFNLKCGSKKEAVWNASCSSKLILMQDNVYTWLWNCLQNSQAHKKTWTPWTGTFQSYCMEAYSSKISVFKYQYCLSTVSISIRDLH